jgi:hypothetical protein
MLPPVSSTAPAVPPVDAPPLTLVEFPELPPDAPPTLTPPAPPLGLPSLCAFPPHASGAVVAMKMNRSARTVPTPAFYTRTRCSRKRDSATFE